MDKNQIKKIDLDKVDWRGSREFFESLGEALDKLDDKDESYDFTWVGKRKAVIEAGAPINKTFRPDVENSKNWDTTENLFIEGDNLDALKLLQESYLGKVKMIYIDPPYNTGKDFVYHDNFKATVENYDEDTEYKDDKGNIQFKKNEKANGRYHSDWLSMMYPRLKLARNLLADDGVIFISIDDNEQTNLKKLCDEIFGEENFITQFIWEKRVTRENRRNISIRHDYILAYARSGELIESVIKNTPMDEAALARYSNPDSDTRGVWTSAPATAQAGHATKSQFYSFDTPGGRTVSPPTGRCWLYTKQRMYEEISKNNIWFGKDGNGVPRIKKFLVDEQGLTPETIWWARDAGTNDSAKRALIKLFGDVAVFDTPKPVQLIKIMLRIGSDKTSTILDFFSGTGTLAEAVLEINAEDGGSRTHIQVQLPEETDEKGEAYKSGYKTIPEISRERIRRAGDKIAKEHPEAKVDYGFRALKITDTNYKEVYKSAGEYQQSTLLDIVDNIKDDRSELDLLYGVLTQSAFELNRSLETRDVAGANIYLYDYFSEISGLVACFASNVPEDTVKAIAKLKPLTAVFRDSSFADSQAKVNLAEHFRILSPETKVKVI